MTRLFLSAVLDRVVTGGRRWLDSAQKGSYDLGLPLSAGSGPRRSEQVETTTVETLWGRPPADPHGDPLTTVFSGTGDENKARVA